MRFADKGKIETLTPAFNPALTMDLKKIAEDLPGIVYEDKGSGIALHYRLAPELQSSLLMMLGTLVPKYPNEFSICEGRKVVEVLPVGFSKGRALRKLATLPAFANKIPVMVGDDIADWTRFERPKISADLASRLRARISPSLSFRSTDPRKFSTGSKKSQTSDAR